MVSKSPSKKLETSPQILMLGYLCVKEKENLTEKVSVLDRFGLSDADISIICDVAPGSVRNARLLLKKASATK